MNLTTRVGYRLISIHGSDSGPSLGGSADLRSIALRGERSLNHQVIRAVIVGRVSIIIAAMVHDIRLRWVIRLWSPHGSGYDDSSSARCPFSYVG